MFKKDFLAQASDIAARFERRFHEVGAISGWRIIMGEFLDELSRVIPGAKLRKLVATDRFGVPKGVSHYRGSLKQKINVPVFTFQPVWQLVVAEHTFYVAQCLGRIEFAMDVYQGWQLLDTNTGSLNCEGAVATIASYLPDESTGD